MRLLELKTKPCIAILLFSRAVANGFATLPMSGECHRLAVCPKLSRGRWHLRASSCDSSSFWEDASGRADGSGEHEGQHPHPHPPPALSLWLSAAVPAPVPTAGAQQLGTLRAVTFPWLSLPPAQQQISLPAHPSPCPAGTSQGPPCVPRGTVAQAGDVPVLPPRAPPLGAGGEERP